MNNLVSVIVAIYNAEKYLDETLVSLLNQTHNNIEIICINDGSTDNSLKILEKYKDRIKIINQENKGQCAASNTGLHHATGDFIKFFDADDIMNPEHIELQIKKLNGRSDAIASCEWGRFYNSNPYIALFDPEPVWQDMKPLEWLKTSLVQKSDMMGAWLWLIPRQIIEIAGGWNEQLTLNNDFEFSIRLLIQAKEVLFTPGAKVFYRSGVSASLSSLNSKSAFKNALLSTDLGCQHLLNAERSDYMKRICANRYQEWVYRMYPKYPDLIIETERKIANLGGSNRKLDGGKIFTILSSLMGWKLAKRVQYLAYQLGYL